MHYARLVILSQSNENTVEGLLDLLLCKVYSCLECFAQVGWHRFENEVYVCKLFTINGLYNIKQCHHTRTLAKMPEDQNFSKLLLGILRDQEESFDLLDRYYCLASLVLCKNDFSKSAFADFAKEAVLLTDPELHLKIVKSRHVDLF